METDQSSARPDFDFRYLCGEGILFDFDQTQQILRRLWNNAKTIHHFSSKAFDIASFFQIVKTAIQCHTHGQVRHIFLWNQYGCINGNLRTEAATRFSYSLCLGSNSHDRFLKHRLIKFKTNLTDMT